MGKFSHTPPLLRPVIMGVALCLLVSCATYTPNTFYIDNILKPCVAHECRVFNVIKTTDEDTLMQRHYTLYRAKDYVCISDIDEDRHYYFSDDALRIVDFRTQELIDFVDSAGVPYGNSIRYYRCQYLDEVTEHFYPLVYQDRVLSLKHKPLYFEGIRDTTADGTPYKVLSRNSMIRFFYNDSTKQYDIPNFRFVEYYYNLRSGSLQRIVSHPMDYPNNKAIEYGTSVYELTTSYEDKRTYLDSLFDFDAPRYRDFSRHNNTDNLPRSWQWWQTTNTVLTDEVLDYPIVSVNNDTTTIRRQEGWLLIDF